MWAQRNEMQRETASGLIKSKLKVRGLTNFKLSFLEGIDRGGLSVLLSQQERKHREGDMQGSRYAKEKNKI